MRKSTKQTLLTGVRWAQDLLSSIEKRHALCKTEFEADDTDGNGSLDREEVLALIQKICARFRLAPPTHEKCEELFAKCDKNHDGSLQLHEFYNYFKVVLESAMHQAERELQKNLASQAASVVNSEASHSDTSLATAEAAAPTSPMKRVIPASSTYYDNESPVVVRRLNPAEADAADAADAATADRAEKWAEELRDQVHHEQVVLEQERAAAAERAVAASAEVTWGQAFADAQRMAAVAVLVVVGATAVAPLLPARGAKVAHEVSLVIASASMLWATVAAFGAQS